MELEIGGFGRSVPQLLGAVYAAARVHSTARPAVFAAIRKAALWDGELDRHLITFLSDPTVAPPLSWRRFPTDERWARQVLGFEPESEPERRRGPAPVPMPCCGTRIPTTAPTTRAPASASSS